MPVDVKSITTERLGRWRKHMIERHTTPMLAVAVGHDHAEGEIHFYIPDGVEMEKVRLLLAMAIELMDQGELTYNEPL